MITLKDLKKQWFQLLDDTEANVKSRVGRLQDRIDMIRMAGGKTIKLSAVEDAAGRVATELKRLKSQDVDDESIPSKLEELQRLVSPVLEFLEKIDSDLSAKAEQATSAYLAKTPAKTFTQSKVQNTPAAPVEKKGENRMKKRIFKEGIWSDVEVKGDELAERIKSYMAANPGVDYATAAIECEKELISETNGTTQSFGEGSSSGRLKRFAEANPSAPLRAAELLLDAKRGEVIMLADRSKWMKVLQSGAERILRVDDTGAGAMREFQERNGAPVIQANGRIAQKKFGYSADGKTFTDRAGTVMPVKSDASDMDEVEFELFLQKHGLALQVYGTNQSSDKLEAIARRTIALLKAKNIDPLSAGHAEVSQAIKAARTSEKFLEVGRIIDGAPELSFIDCTFLAKVY